MIILLRGDLFRNCTLDIQLGAYKSIITHVIKPLAMECKDINIIIVTYNDYENTVKDIFKDYKFFFFIINKEGDQVNNYINTLNQIPEFLINETNNLLILKSDLYFKQDIDYSRISKDKILLQWNLLTYTKSRKTVKNIETHLLFDLSVDRINKKNNFWYGCPDEIQFIGSKNVKKFITEMNSKYRKNVFLGGSLHDLFDFYVNNFDIENISYLNYITNPRSDSDKCHITGNPKKSPPRWLGNELYNYTTYMKNICIHIQTHAPHFKYTNQLILSFLKLTNIQNLKIPIFIVLDDDKSIKNFKNKYKYDYNLIYFLNTEEIINNFHLEFIEKKKDLFKNVINVRWGSGGHRNYVAVKRTYSILELEKIGYEYVWCLDCESLILKNTDIQSIIDTNIKKPLLTVGKNNNGVKYPQIIEKIFGYNFSDYKDISVRMNDFFFIHTHFYKSMIQLLFNKHKQPISYFVTGSEQSLYEYYLYSLYIKNSNDINLIIIDVDLHNNSLFTKIITSNTNIH